MNKSKIKLTLLFCGSLALGVALMVSGIWVPVLLPIGGAVLAATLGGALGLWQGVYAAKDTSSKAKNHSSSDHSEIESQPPTRPSTPFEPEHGCGGHDSHDIYNTQNNMFFMWNRTSNRGDDIQLDNLRVNKLTLT